MAIPISLIRKKYKVDKDGKKTECIRSDVISFPAKQGEVVFDFYETDVVSLQFDYDENRCRVEYEDYETGLMKKAEPYTLFDFSYGADPEKGAYFPGYFSLHVLSGSVTEKYSFFVKPKQLHYNNVILLRDYVNSYYNGLSLDLEHRRRSAVENDEEEYGDSTFMNYFFIENYFPRLIGYINAFVKEQYEELQTKYVISSHPSKIDANSVRWLVKSGVTRNSDITRPTTVLERKTVFTVDNKQNQLFRAYLNFWNTELKSCIRDFTGYLQLLKGRIAFEEKRINKQKEKTARVTAESSVSAYVRKTEAGKLRDYEKSLNSMCRLEKSYTDKLNTLQRYRTTIDATLTSSWVRNVSDTVDAGKGIITNKKLLLMKEMQDRYIGIKRKSGFIKDARTSTDYLAEKSTPKLFETYTYILLMNILSDLGYEINEEETPIGDLMFTLSNQSRLRFERDDGAICDIYYDFLLEKISSHTNQTGYYSFNSRHSKPDFLLSFTHRNNDSIKAIVIDSKWRSLFNIYNEYDDTEVMLALRDYSMFMYFDASKKQMNRTVIEKVFAVYPDYDEMITDLLFGRIAAVGLNICENIEDTKNYEYLTEQISHMSSGL